MGRPKRNFVCLALPFLLGACAGAPNTGSEGPQRMTIASALQSINDTLDQVNTGVSTVAGISSSIADIRSGGGSDREPYRGRRPAPADEPPAAAGVAGVADATADPRPGPLGNRRQPPGGADARPGTRPNGQPERAQPVAATSTCGKDTPVDIHDVSSFEGLAGRGANAGKNAAPLAVTATGPRGCTATFRLKAKNGQDVAASKPRAMSGRADRIELVRTKAPAPAGAGGCLVLTVAMGDAAAGERSLGTVCAAGGKGSGSVKTASSKS